MVNKSILSVQCAEKYRECIWLITIEKGSDIIIDTIKQIIEFENIVNIFENNKITVYSDKYKLLSKIGVHDGINEACEEFLSLIREKKLQSKRIRVAEIGVDIGATAIEACRLLDENDTYCFFDFVDIVDDLLHDLELANVKCKVKGYGNSKKFMIIIIGH